MACPLSCPPWSLGELDAALPPGTARVSPAGRRAVLDERMRQATRLQRA
jgi:hypothetical protein